VTGVDVSAPAASGRYIRDKGIPPQLRQCLTFLANVTQRIVIGDPFTVNRDSRNLAMAIPDASSANRADDLHIGGLDGFAPSISNRVTVASADVSVFTDGSAALCGSRGDNRRSGPFEVQLPPGGYAVSLSAGSGWTDRPLHHVR
jgi:hypothetical protein